MEISLNLPSKPGVYLFKNRRGRVIYVGKAINLKARIRSYRSFPGHPRLLKMRGEVKKIDYILTQSDFEALLLEATLIRKYQPKFNISLKDDKHFLYIKIERGEQFPKVITSRREDDPKSIFFGPFPSAKKTREVLKIIRRIYPFCSQKTLGKRGCFFSYIGLCHPCPSNIVKLKGKEKRLAVRIYRRHISQIIRILKGGSRKILKELDKEMKKKAIAEKFEEAAKLRDKIEKLEYIVQSREKVSSYLEDFSFLQRKQKKELDSFYRFLKEYIGQKVSYPKRIEGYDVSNLVGRQAAGAMVVFLDGEMAKDEYRRFKIKFKKTPDDTAMIEEVLTRRLKHPEWDLPDLILIDGGKPQASVAAAVLGRRGLKIPVLGLAKRLEETIIRVDEGFQVLQLPPDSSVLNLLKRVRDESHRFAKNYHLKLRMKNLLPRS